MKKYLLPVFFLCITLLLCSCSAENTVIPSDISNGSQGLAYTYDQESDSYFVDGIGKCPDTSIVIPEKVNGKPVTVVTGNAFLNCSSITSITFPSTIQRIDFPYHAYPFSGCTSLTTFTFRGSIPIFAYQTMRTLESIVLEDITVIPDEIFSDCPSLTSVMIPDSVTEIGARAFSGCSALNGVVIPDSVTEIGAKAFYGCSALKGVVIPDSVTEIGAKAFYGCTALNGVVIPDSVESIGEGAFENCFSLSDLTIGKSVKSIGSSAFAGCHSLKSIELPDTVTSIDGVFAGCTSFTELDFSKYENLTNMGAFYGCTSLEHIILPPNVTSVYFEECTALKSITFTGNIPEYTYDVIPNLTTIILAEGVTQVHDFAFVQCNSLKKVIISDSVTQIGDAAFGNCAALNSLVIPSSVTELDRPFAECTSITTVGPIGSGASAEIPNLSVINNYFFRDCTALTDVVFPGSVTFLGWGAFDGCTALTSVTIPISVTEFSGENFVGCTSLKNINYEGTVAQWQAIVKGQDWARDTGNYTINCTDGIIPKK